MIPNCILKLKKESEILKPIADTNNKYFVSDEGRIFSCKCKVAKILKVGRQGKRRSHLHVNLPIGVNNKFISKKVHQIVLEAFVGKRPFGMVVRHLNGVAIDNRISNLCYGTPKNNSEDGIKLGETPRGEKNGQAKLTKEDVIEIRKLFFTGGCTQEDISKKYPVSRRHVNDIVNKKYWGWL